MKPIFYTIFFCLLLSGGFSYSQNDSKDLLQVYPYEDINIEIVDGFIFKVQDTDPDTGKLKVEYIVIVKEKYSENYFLSNLKWLDKLESFKGTTVREFEVLEVNINTFSPNEVKLTTKKKTPVGKPIIYYKFSSDKLTVSAENLLNGETKSISIRGRLIPQDEINFKQSTYGMSLLDE
jgi:hypothetical protein